MKERNITSEKTTQEERTCIDRGRYGHNDVHAETEKNLNLLPESEP